MKREDWDARYAEKLVWTVEPNRFVVAEMADLPPGRALDLACGEGRNAVWLAERGWDVTAVDFSGVALRTARRLAAERGVEIEWVEADVLDYTPHQGGYDLVALIYLQLPELELRRVLASSSAAVAPGGTLLVVAHDLLNLTEGHAGPKDPAVLTTPELVVDALDGLEVQKAERVLRPIDGAPRDAVDTLVRARRPPAARGRRSGALSRP